MTTTDNASPIFCVGELVLYDGVIHEVLQVNHTVCGNPEFVYNIRYPGSYCVFSQKESQLEAHGGMTKRSTGKTYGVEVDTVMPKKEKR